MSKLKLFANSVKMFGSRNSSTILTIAGIVGLAGAGVWGCIASTKVKDGRAAIKAERNDILQAKRNADAALDAKKRLAGDFTDEESIAILSKLDPIVRKNIEDADYIKACESYSKNFKKDLNSNYREEIIFYTKLYAPVVGLALLSITSILIGHKILKKKYAAMATAYAALERSYNQYRKKVIDTYGKEVDEKFRKNIVGKTETEVEVVDKDGNVVKKTEETDILDTSADYSILFDATPEFTRGHPQRNYVKLKGFQQMLNDMLYTRGTVLLNDVYDCLGIPRTSDGAVAGWSIKDVEGRKCDGYIDFGLDFDDYDMRHWESDIWLNLNCDGYVQNLISN